MSYKERSALIVGAGVIGLSSAFRLAVNGWRVTIFDPSAAMGASRAAAGMIAPAAEITPGELENFRYQQRALNAWTQFANEITGLSATPIELHRTGTLLVGMDSSDRRQIEQFEQVALSFKASVIQVHRGERSELFEFVSSRIREGLYIEGDAWLNPDQVLTALQLANKNLGVTMVHESVVRVVGTSTNVEVVTETDSFRGDVGFFATGASPLPSGVTAPLTTTIRPVRGMTIRLSGIDRSSAPVLRAYVHGRFIYVVSRPGGYCVLGASSEERKEIVVEVGELQRLLRDALEVVPDFEGAAFVESRVGLRPASRDLSPFLETVDERWAWSSGYYRHGVTLAPLAAERALCFADSIV
ncbi:MAG: FAD-dependent oxidoreductase [Acidimicrobiales bacterium]